MESVSKIMMLTVDESNFAVFKIWLLLFQGFPARGYFRCGPANGLMEPRSPLLVCQFGLGSLSYKKAIVWHGNRTQSQSRQCLGAISAALLAVGML